MKRVRLTALSIFAIASLLLFQNCDETDEKTAKEILIEILTGKTEWTVASVVVPDGTATDATDWDSFKVKFTSSNMTTSGHPTGAEAVWPTGIYTVADDGKTVTRADDVVMTISPASESGFTARFTVPDGTDIGGRIAALGGDYTFNMK